MSTRHRKQRKIRRIKLDVKELDVNELGLKILLVLFHAGRPMSDAQVQERCRFVWGSEASRSHSAIWRCRAGLTKLGLVVDSTHREGRVICWTLSPEGREFVRRYATAS